MLIAQFILYSSTGHEYKLIKELAETPGPGSLDDIDLPPEKIIAAINTLKTEAAAGAEGFPAKVFKECKESLVLPLMLLWRKSLDTGKIPDIMKLEMLAQFIREVTGVQK